MGSETATILIRGARQVLTLRGATTARRGPELNQLNIISDGSVLIRDGLLMEVGPSRRVENLVSARNAIEVNAAGRIVMPGFVDSHTHLLDPATGPHPPNWSTSIRLKTRARACLQNMARHGTTTAEVKTGWAAEEGVELKILRVLSELKKEAIDLLPSLLLHPPATPCRAADASGWRRISSDFLPKIWRRRLVRFADISWEEGLEINGWASRYLETANRLGMGCKVHVELDRPSAGIRAGLAHQAASIDHLEHVSAADTELLGRYSGVATLLPGTSFSASGRFAPARALIEAGAAIALATNFNPEGTSLLSMQAVVALACAHMGLTPPEAIAAATINGACALGQGARSGSLEHGKSADLLILNISDYRELAHQLGTNLVHMTMKAGEFIYEEGIVAPRPAEDLRPAW